MSIYSTTPEGYCAPVPHRRPVNKRAVAGTIAAVLAVGALGGIVVHQQSIITDRDESITALNERNDELAGELESCQDAAQGWKDSTVELTNAFYQYLDIFPWGSLNLDAATDAVEAAKAAGCTDTSGEG